MRALIAIMSCRRDLAMEQAQRDTFLRGAAFDYRFFRGEGCPYAPDAVDTGAPDGFFDLPFKVRAALRWALAAGYEYVFKCDTDTYLRPERLLASGFESADYSGYFTYDPCPGAYASGGSGYWLSARAMRVAVDYEDFIRDSARGDRPSTRGEDLQVGWAMRDAGIHCRKDARYRLYDPGPRRANDYISLHDVVCPLKTPARMAEAHAAWAAS